MIEKGIYIIPIFYNLIMLLRITVKDDANKTHSARTELLLFYFLRRAEGAVLTFA